MSKTMDEIAALQKERYFILEKIGQLDNAMSIEAKPLLTELIRIQKEMKK